MKNTGVRAIKRFVNLGLSKAFDSWKNNCFKSMDDRE